MSSSITDTHRRNNPAQRRTAIHRWVRSLAKIGAPTLDSLIGIIATHLNTLNKDDIKGIANFAKLKTGWAATHVKDLWPITFAGSIPWKFEDLNLTPEQEKELIFEYAYLVHVWAYDGSLKERLSRFAHVVINHKCLSNDRTSCLSGVNKNGVEPKSLGCTWDGEKCIGPAS